MLPDQELGAKIESDEKKRLEDIRAGLSPQQVFFFSFFSFSLFMGLLIKWAARACCSGPVGQTSRKEGSSVVILRHKAKATGVISFH